jgi:sulfate adenylyltransferase subunit 2
MYRIPQHDNSTVMQRTHLDLLESRSVHIIREAFNRFDKLALLWSLGKDSGVLLWLVQKAFFGQVPFPVVHIDTRKKLPEMYEFRTKYAKQWQLDLVLGECPPVEEIDPSLPPAARSAARKTAGLKSLVTAKGYGGIFVGIRADE